MSEDDPTDIHGSRLRQIEREERDKRRQHQELEDIKWLMSSKRGRRIVWRQLELAGVHTLSFDPTGAMTNFNEGRRSVGLHMTALITNNCPERYIEMLNDHRSAQE